VALLGLGLFLAWVYLFRPEPPPPLPRPVPLRPTFVVDPMGKMNGPRTIADAVQRAHGRGARIVLRGDVTEAGVEIRGPNLSTEADKGAQPTWRCPDKADASTMLLRVNNAPGFQLKGLTLDGAGRARALVNLYERCAGATFEDLTLTGFREYGMWVTNCEGEADRPVSLLDLHFVTSGKDQTALFWEVLDHTRARIPRNSHFLIKGCTFDGPGSAPGQRLC
jgi:hypothetical protein